MTRYSILRPSDGLIVHFDNLSSALQYCKANSLAVAIHRYTSPIYDKYLYLCRKKQANPLS